MLINDIVKETHSNIRHSADDISLCIIVDFPESAAQTLNWTWKDYDWAVHFLKKVKHTSPDYLL